MTHFWASGTLIAAIIIGQTMLVRRYWETKLPKASDIVELLGAGIRAESLRQKTIASNVANLETPGYRRVDVKFEELLAKVLASGDVVDLAEIEAQIYRPESTPVKSNGNDVSLEGEVGAMVKNTLRHKTYIRLLNKKLEQLERAIGTR